MAWSFLLMVEILFDLSCLRWKIGLVLLSYGPPPVCILDLVLSAYVSPTVSKRPETCKLYFVNRVPRILGQGLKMGCSESLCKEQSQITFFQITINLPQNIRKP